MAKGRPVKGAQHVDKLEGPESAKERLRIILQTFTGELTVKEAIKKLGISESRFHVLRDEALQGALERLEPKPAGRPAQESNPLAERVVQLEEQVSELEMDLQAARVRTELALVLPDVIEHAMEQEEKKPKKAKRPKRPKPQRTKRKKKKRRARKR